MRIPKIIYSTWISHKPLPLKFNKYIESWMKYLPDFEIRLITLENTPHNSFIDHFIENQKYAVAAQYARCQRLFETGGLYFDIDIEVIKSFDNLLNFGMFAGIESNEVKHYVNNAIFGAVKGHPFMQGCMRYMDNIDIEGNEIEVNTGPLMFTNLMKELGWSPSNKTVYYSEQNIRILKKFGYKDNFWKKGIDESITSNSIQLFNSKYFYPYFYTEQFTPECITKNTYAIHHWAATWVNSVSIIIVCIERDLEFLEDTIQSALNQTVKPIEVVLVINENNKNGDAVRDLAAKHKVKFIETENGNLSSAINAGTDFAKGRWILNLNPGDKIIKEFIEKTIDKSDIVSSGNNEFNYHLFFRKEVWEKIKGFDLSVNDENASHDFWSRAIKEGFSFRVIPHLIFPKREPDLDLMSQKDI